MANVMFIVKNTRSSRVLSLEDSNMVLRCYKWIGNFCSMLAIYCQNGGDKDLREAAEPHPHAYFTKIDDYGHIIIRDEIAISLMCTTMPKMYPSIAESKNKTLQKYYAIRGRRRSYRRRTNQKT